MFNRGRRGVRKVGSKRGEAFFLVAGLTTKLIIAGDGTITGEDFHLTENRFIPQAWLIWK